MQYLDHNLVEIIRHTERSRKQWAQRASTGLRSSSRVGKLTLTAIWSFSYSLYLLQLLRQSVLQVIQCNANSEAETGFLKPAQAFHGPPNSSARVFLIEARLGSASCTRAKTMRDGRNNKSVPLTAAKEVMVVLHTYCFFCACEARSLAFSLAASAVSLARSVAVSANVLDRVSPEGETVAVAVEETWSAKKSTTRNKNMCP